MNNRWQTVIELPEFIGQAKKCLEGDMKEEFINYIAQYPLKGTLNERNRWCS